MIIECLVFFGFVALVLIVGFIVSSVRRIRSLTGGSDEAGLGAGNQKRVRGYYRSGIREETTDHTKRRMVPTGGKRSHGSANHEGPTS
ncbi:MAG TPA: hypothetical protein VNS32_09945 [Flavisolibacter sp.]|nr:hypothetical protein [Flavisolibacter sp.]